MERSDAILARFLALHPKEIDLSLGRIERLLAALGHPELQAPPVVHVAGTNGKGSTVAFLRAMLEAEGRSVHVYTSPHLVRFHERIRLGAPGGGRFVAEDELVATLLEVERINGGEPITVFEITTAAAFVLFARHPADVLLLEVGLGGRFDATNVVPRPVATAVTSISFDHAKFLGDRLEDIAFEKAGILKRGVTGVIARQGEIARGVIEARASMVRAPLIIASQDFDAREERGRLVYEDEGGLLDLPLPRLVGRHQIDNAGTAIALARHLDRLAPQPRAIETGLSTVDWPARLQRLTTGRLARLLPDDGELWLDGGHNPDGGRAVAAAMGEIEERVPRPLALVVGMINTKDSEGFLEPFAGLATRLVAVPIEGHAAARQPEEVMAAAGHAGIPAETAASVEAALAAIAAREGPTPRVLICGSLYLAGEVLAKNGTPPG